MNLADKTLPRRSMRGMTLIEVAVVVAVFSILMVTLHSTLFESIRSFSAAGTAQGLEDMGRAGLDAIKQELFMSSTIPHPDDDDSKLRYPFAWHLGDVPSSTQEERDKYDYAADLNDSDYSGSPYAHYKTDLSAVYPQTTVGDEFMTNDPADDFSTGLVFLTPICDSSMAAELKTYDPHDNTKLLPLRWQQDTVGRWTMKICWGSRLNSDNMYTNVDQNWETVFYLKRDPDRDGNILVRRIYDRDTNDWVPASEREICYHVERITFEPGEPNAYSVRVSIYLRKRDEAGRWMAADLAMNVLMSGKTDFQEPIE